MKALLLFAGFMLINLSCRSQTIWADDSESIQMFKGFLSCHFRWVADSDPALDREEKQGVTYLLLKTANGKIYSVETGQSTPPELDKFLKRATEAFSKMHLFIPVDPCDSTVMIPVKYGLFTGESHESPKKVIDEMAHKDLAQELSEPLTLVSSFNCFFGPKLEVPLEGIRQIIAPYLFNEVVTGQHPERKPLCKTLKLRSQHCH